MSCQLTNSNRDSLVDNLEIIKQAIETIEHNQNFKRQFLIVSHDMGRYLEIVSEVFDFIEQVIEIYDPVRLEAEASGLELDVSHARGLLILLNSLQVATQTDLIYDEQVLDDLRRLRDDLT